MDGGSKEKKKREREKKAFPLISHRALRAVGKVKHGICDLAIACKE